MYVNNEFMIQDRNDQLIVKDEKEKTLTISI